MQNGHATKIGELPMDTAFGDGLGKGGKAGKQPPLGAEKELKKKRQKTNDLVQNYLDSLDPDQPMDDGDGPPRWVGRQTIVFYARLIVRLFQTPA